MKQRVLAICLLLVTLPLCAWNDVTVDLYAGWSWLPFGYDYYGGHHHRHHHHHRHSSYWGWPYAEMFMPLNRFGVLPDEPYYGYFGAPYYWGFGSGVRIKLNERGGASLPDTPLLPELPGSAPLEPRDPQREKAWSTDINAFLGTLPLPDFSTTSATNIPAPASN